MWQLKNTSNSTSCLHIQTNRAEGLLFYTGDGIEDYLNLAMRDGGVSLSINLGSGRLDTGISPSGVRFDDDRWHDVVIKREAQQVHLSLPSLLDSISGVNFVYTFLMSKVKCAHFLDLFTKLRKTPWDVTNIHENWAGLSVPGWRLRLTSRSKRGIFVELSSVVLFSISCLKTHPLNNSTKIKPVVHANSFSSDYAY